ncbi:MAG: hypothetical protein ACFFCS_06855 [Candidatus Hodarchaeota archaeon]
MGYASNLIRSAQAGRGPKKVWENCHNCQSPVKVAPSPYPDWQRCKFCFRAFCKKCGVSFACFACLANLPDEEKLMLIKVNKQSKIAAYLGLIIAWIGLIPVAFFMLFLFYTKFPLFIFPPFSYVFWPCVGLIALGFPIGILNNTKMRRVVSKTLEKYPEAQQHASQQVNAAAQATSFVNKGQCPSCGGMLRGNWCHYCNARVCMKCGKLNLSGDSATCVYCGNNL